MHVDGRDEPPGPLTPDGFAARLQACTPALWAAAAGILGDRTSAEDVVQEAALIGLQKLGQFEPGTSFIAWMGRIVRNVALNQARLGARRRTYPMGSGDLDQHPATGAALAPGQLARDLERAAADPASLGDVALFEGPLASVLDELRPVVRACLLLKTVIDLGYREIGALLDIPEGTAMSHVHRARQQLRERLAPSPGPGQASPVEPRR